MIKDVEKAISILEDYHDSIDWSSLTESGNACYKPYRDDDHAVVNQLIADVRNVMPHFSDSSKDFCKIVASDLEQQYVYYDFLVKAIARILAGFESEKELLSYVRFSRTIRSRMKDLGISEIKSLSDVGLNAY